MRSFMLLLLTLAVIRVSAQELNCKVTINADQIQTSDRTVFKDMERAFANFLNSRKWTNDNLKNYEKINCSLFLNINKMPAIGSFSANVQVTSARPVFNTNYETVVFNFADREWEFAYVESQPLEYNDNTYINNLTSMLAFYAYVIIGMDYDSFAEMGGTPYFQKALMVVNNAQPGNAAGWQALGSNRNRYALVVDLNNPQMADLRRNTYRYHRLALDTFGKTPDQSREIILDIIKNVKKVWTIYPNGIFIISFFDAKAVEMVNIFSDGSLSVRREAYDLLTAMDSKRNIYQKIISN